MAESTYLFRHGLASMMVAIAFMMATLPVGFGQSPSLVTNSRIELIVTDKNRRFVDTIKKEELIVTVGGKRIDDFDLKLETRPAAFVLAIDNSGSLRTIFPDIIDGVKTFLGQTDQGNLVLLMRFVGRDKIQTAEKFSADPKYLESKLNLFGVERGQTALIDAVYKAVQIIAGQNNLANQYRRAVVVISDGEDRDSANSVAVLRELIVKEKIQVFFVGLTDLLEKESGFITRSPRNRSKEFVDTITRESGGVAIYPKAESITEGASAIQTMLNNQYVLTVQSSTPFENDAKVKIEFAPNADRKKTNLHYKPTIRPDVEKN